MTTDITTRCPVCRRKLTWNVGNVAIEHRTHTCHGTRRTIKVTPRPLSGRLMGQLGGSGRLHLLEWRWGGTGTTS